MILDPSAVVAIVFQEPGFEEQLAKLQGASHAAIGVPTLTETAIVLSARMRRDARGLLARFLEEASVVPVPFGHPHYVLTVGAWLRYGKGRHPAALNLGDCLAYAVARLAGEPLLCTGEEFGRTDCSWPDPPPDPGALPGRPCGATGRSALPRRRCTP